MNGIQASMALHKHIRKLIQKVSSETTVVGLEYVSVWGFEGSWHLSVHTLSDMIKSVSHRGFRVAEKLLSGTVQATWRVLGWG